MRQQIAESVELLTQADDMTVSGATGLISSLYGLSIASDEINPQSLQYMQSAASALLDFIARTESTY